MATYGAQEGPTMKLTRTERWILSNQYRILAKLDPKDWERYARAEDALNSGYELEYDGLAKHVYEDTLPTEECVEVINILEMHRMLKYGLDRLEDKTGIDAQAITFHGFDGNNETKQLAYARFVCAKGTGRYEELDRGDDFNSHSPTLPRYRSMLERWRASADKYQLSKPDIVRILAR
jgi:uncharacterized protein YfbU (UPF0304 family)